MFSGSNTVNDVTFEERGSGSEQVAEITLESAADPNMIIFSIKRNSCKKFHYADASSLDANLTAGPSIHIHIPHATNRSASISFNQGGDVFFRVAFFISKRAANKLIGYFTLPSSNTPTFPKVKVPVGQKDIITGVDIEDGMTMADFQKERDERGRYYTKDTYDKLQIPKKNPWTRQPIASDDVQFYIAELDDAMPVVRAGRRRTRRRRLV